MIDHTQLSQFRTGLSFSQTTNLLVYVLYHVKASGILKDCLIHGIDSTEIVNEERYPLFTAEILGKKIRVYSDLDSDCGKRRKKRNKSDYFVGYRMHTLTAIDRKTGQSYPLASLVAAGNHHDSHFLSSLIQLAQAMGIEMKLVTADEAYHDKDGDLFRENGVKLITPPSKRIDLPANVDHNLNLVTCDNLCEIPMEYLGFHGSHHEFKCGAQKGECSRVNDCLQYREIPVDRGVFQPIITAGELAQKAINVRKNIERPFNLLKHRKGRERPRVRSQNALIVKCAFATMANLLIELERKCLDREKDNPQLDFFDCAA